MNIGVILRIEQREQMEQKKEKNVPVFSGMNHINQVFGISYIKIPDAVYTGSCNYISISLHNLQIKR